MLPVGNVAVPYSIGSSSIMSMPSVLPKLSISLIEMVRLGLGGEYLKGTADPLAVCCVPFLNKSAYASFSLINLSCEPEPVSGWAKESRCLARLFASFGLLSMSFMDKPSNDSASSVFT